MKILIKECKKIMDIRVLLVIAVFTVLFYHLFLEVTIYPREGRQQIPRMICRFTPN